MEKKEKNDGDQTKSNGCKSKDRGTENDSHGDGSRRTEGPIGAGGICRDHLGNLIMAFQQSLGTGSSNLAEAKAAMIGLKWCKEYGVPWLLQEVFNESRKVIDESNCIIQHCYREGNQVVDALAKASLIIPNQVSNSANDLPSYAKGP
ncbi:uncharacterized protein LOC132640256 [Lycium barbarum]|uniref:uncharacterized protein LOC132616530 n=1 Tax=Lycium barbarum TaxID=112863 RepID=UPI00293E4532|nr:uncharacterized protein LOC132616530 [Lycium barbarum]XP_060186968.1 uncharacterized protein LOC132616530 [Lycium barbarum]XP_060186969.1 uncharacterized protein LOC132616530 [Lycium barbarum]XP_060186970.1 uncharacterized protein LOC132616530 [Lycium barbarum]XP_060186971.1 uncharacterized protein LOC132616530 [Lycium barbarum]XP_060186972.1 uncharacterized protein LOC132616530 [Lycium barbarum]XP_060186973.1 uncharacterized protein LOC132616530 [Lycium barbarum]XP_060186974.1 uncharacte